MFVQNYLPFRIVFSAYNKRVRVYGKISYSFRQKRLLSFASVPLNF